MGAFEPYVDQRYCEIVSQRGKSTHFHNVSCDIGKREEIYGEKEKSEEISQTWLNKLGCQVCYVIVLCYAVLCDVGVAADIRLFRSFEVSGCITIHWHGYQ